jgi:hypothetical protein
MYQHFGFVMFIQIAAKATAFFSRLHSNRDNPRYRWIVSQHWLSCGFSDVLHFIWFILSLKIIRCLSICKFAIHKHFNIIRYLRYFWQSCALHKIMFFYEIKLQHSTKIKLFGPYSAPLWLIPRATCMHFNKTS